MDILAEELAQARARGAVFSVLRRAEPWGISFNGTRPLTAHVLLQGDAWLEQDGESPRRVRAGDCILVRSGAPYRMTSHPGTGSEPIDVARQTGDDDRDGPAGVLLCGAYVLEGSVGRSLVNGLPRFVVLGAEERDSSHAAAVALLKSEVQRAAPGQQTLLDRLLDLNLVYALRSWWARADARPPGWYRASADPGLGPVLDHLHAEPQRPWTVQAMADLAGMSRAGFAARFAEIVGLPPRRYLTELRMRRAQDLLERTDSTLAHVATQVGYSNEFAFATAFRRCVGSSPGAWRIERRS